MLDRERVVGRRQHTSWVEFKAEGARALVRERCTGMIAEA